MSTSNAISSPPTDLSKLDELEELTKKYSLYSGSAYGLGHLPGWALLVLALSLGAAGIHRWGIWIAAAAPWVWLATREPIRRRLYQREGRVTELGLNRVERAVGMVILTVLGLIAAVHIRSLALPNVVAPISALASVVVAVFCMRSARDAGNWFNMVAFLLWVSHLFTERDPDHFPRTLECSFLLLAVLYFLGVFIHEHIQYRRLEKRLASLRSAL